ncbi:MAG: sugar kinase, partial [Saprospiraceae bacterium]
MSELKWGIDLGGTKIEGAVLQIKDNQPDFIVRKRIPTESHLGYEHIIDSICALLEDLKKETGTSPDQLGIGTPGSYD